MSVVVTKSESEVSSQTGQSSPCRPVYYVESPSHDGEKTTNSVHSSPMGSPPHSRSNSTSSTRFSGSARKHSGPHHRKDQFDAIEEEALLDRHGDSGSIAQFRRCYFVVLAFGFLALFSLFSLILWGASKPHKPDVVMKSILFDQFVVQAGTDFSGVATELVSMNSTVKFTFRNSATFFGVHVTSTPLDLSYSQLTVATGTIKKFYLSRKSHRSITVTLRGSNIPLYGGGSSLGSSNGAPLQPVSLILDFMVRSRAYVLGRLVKPKFYRRIKCLVVMDPKKMSTAITLKNKCTY